MKKLLAYYGLIDGKQLTPEQQENIGRLQFLLSILSIPIIIILVYLLS